jgi:predicted transcriptional regulator
MGKQVEVPRYNVVSMRVSDEEHESLLAVAKELSISISAMMRQAMALLAHNRDMLQQ